MKFTRLIPTTPGTTDAANPRLKTKTPTAYTTTAKRSVSTPKEKHSWREPRHCTSAFPKPIATPTSSWCAIKCAPAPTSPKCTWTRLATTSTHNKVGVTPTSMAKKCRRRSSGTPTRSEEHTSELQSRGHLVCRLLLEKKQHNDNLYPVYCRGGQTWRLYKEAYGR